MSTRDPRIDPQPGDEMRGGSDVRRVLKRDGGKLLVQKFTTGFNPIWMRVDTWQKWCKQSGVEVVDKQEG